MNRFDRACIYARMTKKTQAPNSEHSVVHILASNIFQDAPEWVTVFPQLGSIQCRDGRNYIIDADKLIAQFASDGIDIPVDLNHSTEDNNKQPTILGWIKELRKNSEALEARVEWLDSGIETLAGRQYRYVSPSFWADKSSGAATRMKALALVAAPALSNQPALASAENAETLSINQENSMKSIAVALGLSENATEPECLAALTKNKESSVPKDAHEATLAQLSATSSELQQLKADIRKGKVEAVIEGALKEKKLLPAEKDHFLSLCSTDDGLDTVQKLLSARSPVLQPTSTEGQPQNSDPGSKLQPEQLAAAAHKIMEEKAKVGQDITIADAMSLVIGS